MIDDFVRQGVGGWSDCWQWTGERKHDGTPVYRDLRGKPEPVLALLYEREFGAAPTLDLSAMGCPTAWCVNPRHIKGAV